MERDTLTERSEKRNRTVTQTKNLLEIEKAGFRWAVRCFDYYFTREDLEFFALEYKPFYESLQEMQKAKGSVVSFDPFTQHKHCEILFGIAFSRHGAHMVSQPGYPLGKVPDLRFAAFERGVIKSLRNLCRLERHGKVTLK